MPYSLEYGIFIAQMFQRLRFSTSVDLERITYNPNRPNKHNIFVDTVNKAALICCQTHSYCIFIWKTVFHFKADTVLYSL